jgi:tetratricopeptide (TPR) repeat protein
MAKPVESKIPPTSMNSSASLKQKGFTWLFMVTAAVLIALVSWAYANHFDNEFEFDDDHTIVKNSSLDTLNIGSFMTDVRTYSTLPANQSWRPGITILNSIDTIRGGRVPVVEKFHQHIFASYIALGVLLFFFFLHLLKLCFPDNQWNNWVALLSTGFFWLHTANAETINYIIARSDSQSTLMIILSFVMYFYWGAARKYLLFLIPMALGFLIKEVTIMVAPLLVVFLWLFSKEYPNKKPNIIAVVVAFLVAGLMYYISRKMTLDTWTSGGGNWFLYLCTELFVMVHYVFTFILPVNLSADTDWTYVTYAYDTRVFAGAAFIAAMLYFAYRFSKKQETKMASFGIMWFFITLAPTSSVVPFSEVMNDHRIFLPFIGLIMVVANGAVLLIRKFEFTPNGNRVKWAVVTCTAILLLVHTIGTRERCEVWDNGESLWKDVTVKSPKNGRGWMNYGLALMARNSMDSAIIIFNKTLELNPNYSYGNINMAIAQSSVGKPIEAERYFKYALALDSINPECYYYYADFLNKQGRYDEALTLLQMGHERSPGHGGINQMLAVFGGNNFKTPLEAAILEAKNNPTPESYVNLSLLYYQSKEYNKSAQAAEQAAALKPDYVLAWNNICAAYNMIGEFEKAALAGRKAVELSPKEQLYQNNLATAENQSKYFESLTASTLANPTYENWINLSLAWYNASNFTKSKEAAEEAVKINPKDPLGWNNICAACNQLGDYQRGIEAGLEAVKLNPQWEIANNNLKEAQRIKAQSAGK